MIGIFTFRPGDGWLYRWQMLGYRVHALSTALLLGFVPALTSCKTAPPPQEQRATIIHGTFGTYAGAPRLSDGHVDVRRLVGELKALHAQTYNWLIWTAATDWEDLHGFLPLSKAAGLRVWVTLVPPSESPPHTKYFSEPFKLDYERWAVEIARLSKRYPNLVAWSVDDFSHNRKELAPERLEAILRGARAINPRLAFVPCIYYRHVKPEFAAGYKPLLDGVLFPYRHEAGEMNLSQYDTLEQEVGRLKELFGKDMPVFIDVYSTKHSRLNDSSPEYVRQVMVRGWKAADGVLIYCHPSEQASPAKYSVVKELFGQWAN